MLQIFFSLGDIFPSIYIFPFLAKSATCFFLVQLMNLYLFIFFLPITLPNQLGEILDRNRKIPGVDKVEWVLIDPVGFDVVYQEFHIGWDPVARKRLIRLPVRNCIFRRLISLTVLVE